VAQSDPQWDAARLFLEGFGGGVSGLVPDLGGLNLLGPVFIYLNEMRQGDTKYTMAGANMLTLTDSTFDREVLNSDVPVLVDFWAEWCGPCRMMEPTIEAIAADYAGKVKVGKLNVDDNGATAMRFNIRGIPTLLLFKGGKVVDQRVGAVGKSEVQKMLDAHLG
jgi:thioredoxin 1